MTRPEKTHFLSYNPLAYRHKSSLNQAFCVAELPHDFSGHPVVNAQNPGPKSGVLIVRDTGIEPVTSSVSGKRATAAPIALYSFVAPEP